jgi:hypothetical protein
MRLSALLRGISCIVVRLVVKPGAARDPSARWQDKSRKLRRGRAVEERKHFKHLARGAPAHDSLPLCVTRWHCSTAHTSRTPAS